MALINGLSGVEGVSKLLREKLEANLNAPHITFYPTTLGDMILELAQDPGPGTTLIPIEKLKYNQTVVLWGPSGHDRFSLRCAVGWRDMDYATNNQYRTLGNNDFTDDGGLPLYWSELPIVPKTPTKKEKIRELLDRMVQSTSDSERFRLRGELLTLTEATEE